MHNESTTNGDSIWGDYVGMAARVFVVLRFRTKVRVHHTNVENNNGCFFIENISNHY